MAFPESHLHANEELVLNLKPHWWTFAGTVTLVVGALVAAVLLNVAVDVTVLGWIGWLLLLAALVRLGVVYGTWLNTYFVLTSERLIFRRGVLSKSGIEIPLNRINNVNFRQSLFERVIGAGDLLVESAGESGQSRFSDVRKPDAVQNEIYRQIERQRTGSTGPAAPAEGAAPAAPPAAPGATIAQQIEELDQLRRKGLVTEEEFERKRRELLDRM